MPTKAAAQTELGGTTRFRGERNPIGRLFSMVGIAK
jgi:hypothetical protein